MLESHEQSLQASVVWPLKFSPLSTCRVSWLVEICREILPVLCGPCTVSMQASSAEACSGQRAQSVQAPILRARGSQHRSDCFTYRKAKREMAMEAKLRARSLLSSPRRF